MNRYKIMITDSQTTLYEGEFTSFAECLEHAVLERVNLSHADLRHQNLSNANLDDARLPYADFSGANLTGANLSESRLEGAQFNHTALYNTCLAYTNMQRCNFEDSNFGATDITGADISFGRFSTLSCFTLDFTHAKSMKGCTFINPDGKTCAMSHPPIVIKGLEKTPFVIMDAHVKIAHDIMDIKQWFQGVNVHLRTQQTNRIT